jgi:UDP-glucose 4-epimerase
MKGKSASLVLVTGGSGFVGRAVLERMVADGRPVRAAVRRTDAAIPSCVEVTTGAHMDSGYDWRPSLEGVGVIVHTAARVHQMRDTSGDVLAEFRRVNVAGTLELATQAAAAGVGRFVFLSSIKVNGEETRAGAPFAEDDPPAPCDPYGVSKLEAEAGLREIAARTGMEVVIIRPVLVYGPGVKANFLSLMRWVARGVPLPLGAIHNRRSLVALDNLVDLVATCIRHPGAANEVFLVSDGEDLSTTDLVRKMAAALGRPARLIAVPAWALEVGAALLGKRGTARRLIGSLQVDITKARTRLGWTPPVSVDEGLAKTVTAMGLLR